MEGRAAWESYVHQALSLDGKVFRAHRLILAAPSPSLGAMFEQDLGGKTESRVDTSEMSENTLRDLVRFIYTGGSGSSR